MRRTLATHSTGELTWRARSSRRRAASRTGSPVTLLRMGGSASDQFTEPNAFDSASPTGAMAGEWNGPLTRRAISRFAPAARKGCSAAARSEAVPEMTTCPGALSLATTRDSRAATPWIVSSMMPRSSPMTATIPPPATASAISDPRSATSRSASAAESTPAAASAAYSPTE